MSNTLKQLFDYQKFEGNPELQRVIDSVHNKYTARELTFEEMEMVNAAGSPELLNKKKDRRD